MASLHALFLMLLFSGCMSMSFRQTPVQFPDPRVLLEIETVAPNVTEQLGVTFRLKRPPGGTLESGEHTIIYARIRDGRGIELKLMRHRTDRYAVSSWPDAFRIESKTVFEKDGGKLFEHVELSDRGEILRFIEGKHDSKIGKFDIQEWSRTSVFPKGPVRVGSSWQYEESIDVRLHSFLVKQEDPEPYTLRATSVLEGYALVKGRRAAVIRTKAIESKRERLKVMMMPVELNILTQVDETAYFDYSEGRYLAKVIQTESKTLDPNGKVLDYGKSQSVYTLNEILSEDLLQRFGEVAGDAAPS